MDKTKTQLLPLTRSQTSLWLTDKLNPNLPINNDPYAFYIKGELNVDKFKLAFRKLVDNTDVLRLVVLEADGVPYQKINSFLVEYITYLNFENKEFAEVEEWINARGKVVFDTSKKLFDSVLIKLNSDDFIWYLNMHHIITDATSRVILFERMSNIYEEFIKNDISSFIEENKYSAFIDFEKRSAAKRKELTTYWESKIEPYVGVTSFYSSKKTGNASTKSHRVEIKLSRDNVNRLISLAENPEIKIWSKELTFFSVFTTVMFTYLYRTSGERRLMIGAPIHNRATKAFKETVGLFMEIFPLAVEIDEGETFISLLKKVQAETIDYLKNGQTGASSAKIGRNYTVILNYLNIKYSNFAGYKTFTRWIHPDHVNPKHKLSFHIHDFDDTGQLQLYFDLNTNAFDTDTQELVPQHFFKMLDAFIENHRQSIDTISLVTETELSKIQSWNDTIVEYPKGETLLTQFEAQVLKTPNNAGLVFQDESLTYLEFNEKSNQVAYFLVEKGIKRNDIVAISLERSLDMMIFIYGILKAGGAYLPVDTHTPIERLTFILKDSKSKIIFYNHDNFNDDHLTEIDSFKIDEIKNQLIGYGKNNCDMDIAPEDLAYVIYTSGSTGEPKGVKCHHGCVCNTLNWMHTAYPVADDDIFLQKTPITFDVSIWELFWPMQSGVTMVIEAPNAHKDPNALIDTINKYSVTTLQFVPTMLNIFAQTDGVETCKSIKYIFCCGEALSVSVVEATYAKLDNVEVHNLYGPTEAAVGVTGWFCEKDEYLDGIPIGRPFANTQIYILDKHLNHVPVGLMGELYIAGKQVALGYLNRESLTKKRFLKDIYSEDASATMYKTGDLASYRHDGIIEYHGRVDNQIKLRGQRIELGEIESNIERHDAISQAVVSVDDRDNLVAYYIGDAIEDTEMISLLVRYLPDYMVPRLYMRVGSFELLSNGKVNRKKLPKLKVSDKISKIETILAPRNEFEELIHGVWTEVLDMENIGINENFFRIGGNSLNAISITSRLKAALELEVSVTDIFNYPTIAVYSKHIEEVMIELLGE